MKNKQQHFIEKANIKHNYKFDYSKVEYINLYTKVIIICKNHGEFLQTPRNHYVYNGCKTCKLILLKTSQKDFLEKSKLIHNDIYDYSKSLYNGTLNKIIIICKKHGEFLQTPNNHLAGQGCVKCSIEKQKYSEEEIIKKFNNIHNGIYDYSKFKYIKGSIKSIIICKKHGEFLQEPYSHLRGFGCRQCANDNHSHSQNEVIKKFNKIHNNIYDYSKVEYLGVGIKIIIICSKHGDFKQKPNDHLRGHGCPKCSTNSSKPEQDWLNSLNVFKQYRNYKIKINNKSFNVDGFDPKTNTIYEFYGDYWHGNPQKYNSEKMNNTTHCTFGKLFEKTIAREQIIKNAGYKLVAIWESEWKIKK